MCILSNKFLAFQVRFKQAGQREVGWWSVVCSYFLTDIKTLEETQRDT
jgi:hypothetical protein